MLEVLKQIWQEMDDEISIPPIDKILKAIEESEQEVEMYGYTE